MTKRNIIAVIILLVVAIGAYVGSGMMGGEKKEEGPQGFAMPVEATKAESATLRQTVQAVGSLIAQEGVVVRPEISGRVTQIFFNEGQKVDKGAPLMRLDDSVNKAQLSQAEAQLNLAQRNYTRAVALVGRGAGTEQARDQAASDQRTASAALDLARANLDKTLLSAPFAGTVGIRKVSLGDYVSPGQVLVSLQALDTMKVDFSVPESTLSYLKPTLPVDMTVASYPGEHFAGQVTAIDPLVDPATRSVSVRAIVPNLENKLRPGLFANVTLVLGEIPETVFVPASAIWPVNDKVFVFKVENSVANMVSVEILQRESGRVALAQGSVKAGDEIVTSGQLKLAMGGGQPMPVMVIPAAGAAPATPAPAAEEEKAGH